MIGFVLPIRQSMVLGLLGRLPETDPRATAVLIDELYPRLLQSGSNGCIVGGCHGGLILRQLGATDRGNSNLRMSRKIFRAPPKKRPPCTYLRAYDIITIS